jgi:hypothetical protein
VSGTAAASDTLCDDEGGSSDGVGDPGSEAKSKCVVSGDSAKRSAASSVETL